MLVMLIICMDTISAIYCYGVETFHTQKKISFIAYRATSMLRETEQVSIAKFLV